MIIIIPLYCKQENAEVAFAYSAPTVLVIIVSFASVNSLKKKNLRKASKVFVS